MSGFNRIILFSFLFLAFGLIGNTALAQGDEKDFALAQQYYQMGEYEKAAELFEKLWSKDINNGNYYNNLYRTLLQLEDFDGLEKVVKKQVKKNPEQLRYLVDLGYVYQQANEAEKGAETYQEAIDAVPANDFQIRVLANTFTAYRELEYTVKTFEHGNKILNDPDKYNFELGQANLQKGDLDLGLDYLIRSVEKQPEMDQRMKTLILNSGSKEQLLKKLEGVLYGKIQDKPNEVIYPELLTWVFLQRKDFESALVQVKALDKRNNEDGSRVLELARMAKQESDYEVAIEAYSYLLEKGDKASVFLTAKKELLGVRKERIEESLDFTRDDVLALKSDYQSFLADYGKNQRTAQTIRELAQLEAFYLYQLDSALVLLEGLVEMPTIDPTFRNEVKIDLGDLYVAMGEVWEATLLYAQVDKAEKDSPLGELARFKNAKLSYFKGEFEWAQAQLSILKASTTELIANDALDLSIFILENSGLDTSYQAMKIYSRGELLIYQNRIDSAVKTLDSIGYLFPGHELADDVLMTKAEIALKQKDFDKATTYLKQIVELYPDGLLGDNSLFLLGEIHERYLNDADSAQEFYKQLIFDYQDSVLLVEARKRFRSLRGDDVSGEPN
jgi:tetratricopeptide (TPR) repeat protein